MATTSVKLSDDLTHRLRHMADLKRRSPHWIMVEAIRRYLEQEEKRAAFYADALVSWQEYQEDGQHVTWEEMRGWIATWGTDSEKEPPQWHK